MQDQQEIEALQARVAELEADNRRLERALPTGARWRAPVAAVLILLGVLLAPLAAVGAWARMELIDTDRFVQTFAPLANDPAVQQYVSDQTMQAIEANLDIDGLVGEVFAGIGGLGLPPRTQGLILLLEAPAAEGVRSTLRGGVDRVVASPRFAQLWETALRQTHSRTVTLIQGDPNAILQLDDAGVIAIDLGNIIAEVKRALVAQGFGLADRIPEVDRTIPLVASDSLVLIRTTYQLVVALGYWLPWIALGLLALGVAVARSRPRALAWAGLGLAVSFILLSLGVSAGELFFVGSVSPSLMPAATAHAIFGQLTLLMSATVLALTAASAALAIGAWSAGGSRPARALRSATDSGFATVRTAAEKRGVTTGAFGRVVHRWSRALVIATVAIGVLVLFLDRPMRMGSVVATVVVVLLALLAIGLVRRPEPAAALIEEPEPDARER